MDYMPDALAFYKWDEGLPEGPRTPEDGLTQPLGKIPLSRIRRCEYLLHKRQGCRLDVTIPGRVYSLRASSPKVARAWVKAIHLAIRDRKWAIEEMRNRAMAPVLRRSSTHEWTLMQQLFYQYLFEKDLLGELDVDMPEVQAADVASAGRARFADVGREVLQGMAGVDKLVQPVTKDELRPEMPELPDIVIFKRDFSDDEHILRYIIEHVVQHLLEQEKDQDVLNGDTPTPGEPEMDEYERAMRASLPQASATTSTPGHTPKQDSDLPERLRRNLERARRRRQRELAVFLGEHVPKELLSDSEDADFPYLSSDSDTEADSDDDGKSTTSRVLAAHERNRVRLADLHASLAPEKVTSLSVRARVDRLQRANEAYQEALRHRIEMQHAADAAAARANQALRKRESASRGVETDLRVVQGVQTTDFIRAVLDVFRRNGSKRKRKRRSKRNKKNRQQTRDSSSDSDSDDDDDAGADSVEAILAARRTHALAIYLLWFLVPDSFSSYIDIYITNAMLGPEVREALFSLLIRPELSICRAVDEPLIMSRDNVPLVRNAAVWPAIFSAMAQCEHHLRLEGLEWCTLLLHNHRLNCLSLQQVSHWFSDTFALLLDVPKECCDVMRPDVGARIFAHTTYIFVNVLFQALQYQPQFDALLLQFLNELREYGGHNTQTASFASHVLLCLVRRVIGAGDELFSATTKDYVSSLAWQNVIVLCAQLRRFVLQSRYWNDRGHGDIVEQADIAMLEYSNARILNVEEDSEAHLARLRSMADQRRAHLAAGSKFALTKLRAVVPWWLSMNPHENSSTTPPATDLFERRDSQRQLKLEKQRKKADKKAKKHAKKRERQNAAHQSKARRKMRRWMRKLRVHPKQWRREHGAPQKKNKKQVPSASLASVKVEKAHWGLHWNDAGRPSDLDLCDALVELFELFGVEKIRDDLRLPEHDRQFAWWCRAERQFWRDVVTIMRTVQLADIETKKLLTFRELSIMLRDFVEGRAGRQAVFDRLTKALNVHRVQLEEDKQQEELQKRRLQRRAEADAAIAASIAEETELDSFAGEDSLAEDDADDSDGADDSVAFESNPGTPAALRSPAAGNSPQQPGAGSYHSPGSVGGLFVPPPPPPRDQQPSPPKLPPRTKWKQVIDSNSGTSYFYHLETFQTQWEVPPEGYLPADDF